MNKKNVKLCKCGCGQPVKKRRDGSWNDYIIYHYKHSEEHKNKLCGENNPSKRPEVRKKISKKLKNKYKDTTHYMQLDENKKKHSKIMKKYKGENHPMYGRKHTEESKKKMSKSTSGKNHPNYGKKLSEETKKKMSEAWNKERRNKKIYLSEEMKIKLSKAFSGEGNHFYGKKHSRKTRNLLSKKAKERFKNKENHPAWRGGVSFEHYPIEFDKSLKLKVRNRDGNICQNPECNKKIKNGDVHHIDYIKENCCEKNLITLCKSCHTKTNANREYWKNFYKKIIRLKYE